MGFWTKNSRQLLSMSRVFRTPCGDTDTKHWKLRSFARAPTPTTSFQGVAVRYGGML